VTRGEVLAKLREKMIAFAASCLSRDAAEDLVQEIPACHAPLVLFPQNFHTIPTVCGNLKPPSSILGGTDDAPTFLKTAAFCETTRAETQSTTD